MAVAFVLVLVAVGSVVFHLLSPWWWTPIASTRPGRRWTAFSTPSSMVCAS